MEQVPVVLLLEDHAFARRSIVRLLADRARIIAATCCSDARLKLTEGAPLTGAILDVRLPDGSGFEIAEMLRDAHPRLPILVLTGEDDDAVVEKTQLVGAEYLPKPPATKNLFAFVERCSRYDPVATYVLAHGLSTREQQLIRHVLSGHGLKETPALMGVAASTVHTYVRRILRKTKQPSMADVIRQIWSSTFFA